MTRAPSAATAEVDGQLVALDVSQGICYGLNRVATRIWQLIEAPRSARDVATVLLDEFDVAREDCELHTLDLLRDLVAARLAH